MDAHDADGLPEIDATHADAVRRVLDEAGVEAERALVVLARAIVGRHVDVELRKRGRRAAYSPGNARLDALVATLDALFEAQHRMPGAAGTMFAPGPLPGPRAADRDVGTATGAASAGDAADPALAGGDPDAAGDHDGDLAAARQAVIAMLVACQLVGDRAAGLLDEDDGEDDGPRMRIARDED